MSTTTATASVSTTTGNSRALRYLLLVAVVVGVISMVRVLTGAHEITSSGSLRAALSATVPILMAALGGLWSERAGVVNIGLEGQMLLGTWGAAFGAYHLGPYQGILLGIAFGALGGLLHALATVTFGVDHIVSGVALNVIALGLTTFLAEAFFTNLNSQFGRGGPRQLTGLQNPDMITIPGISDAAVWLNNTHWFLLGDLGGLVAALTTRISVITVVAFALVVLTAWVLWRTTFGLRLRSCGENPQAAESLGVNVIRHKYAAVVASGAFAGLGGAYLALVSSPGFVVNQTGGRGYIGLAAMIFGNWRPAGVLMGSGLFGYTDSLRLRDPSTVHALLLLLAIGLGALAIMRVRKGQMRAGLIIGAFAALFVLWFALTDSVPREFTSMTPYVLTLLVLAFASQRLRMPKADGQIYRKGSAG